MFILTTVINPYGEQLQYHDIGVNFLYNAMLCVVGDHCEFCLPGSFGDATVAPGCLPCQCNGHGLADLDLCNITTGVCFCEEGFLGDFCELCDITSTGDPRLVLPVDYLESASYSKVCEFCTTKPHRLMLPVNTIVSGS